MTERIEFEDETLHYAEEDWNDHEQTEVDKRVEPNITLTMEMRKIKRGRAKKRNNPCGDDFVVDRIALDDITDSVLSLNQIMVLQDFDLVDDTETDWIDNRSEPEMDFESESERLHEQKLTNLRVVEWLHDLPAGPKETVMTIQDFNQSSIKYISRDNTNFELQNQNSNNIWVRGSDFILMEQKYAIAITADVSFKTALAANFKR